MKNLQAWSMKNTVDFYVQERSHAKDLYPSEAAILLPVLPHVGSMLDVGCAVGNFSAIMKELQPRIAYVGIDTSEEMVKEARRRHPDAEFRVGGDVLLPFRDESFDMAFCTGVLHHNPDYLDMIAEMSRVAKRFVVVDLPRLVLQPYAFSLDHSYMILKDRFPAGSDSLSREGTKVPYVLAGVAEAFGDLLNRFAGRTAGIAAYGYYGTPHKSVSLPIDPVLFTVVLIVKGQGPPRYHVHLPDEARAAAEAVLASSRGLKVDSVEAVLTGHRS